jgi:hypothetical protein
VSSGIDESSPDEVVADVSGDDVSGDDESGDDVSGDDVLGGVDPLVESVMGTSIVVSVSTASSSAA